MPSNSPQRRTFLRSAVAGSLLMPAILHELLAGDAAGRSARAAAAHSRRGQARHLSVHERRRLARRFLRSQAEADRRSWPNRHARSSRNAQSARLRTTVSQTAAVDVSISTANRASRSARCSRTSPRCVDDLCVIRSMHGDHSNHYNATLGMHTGSFNFARPSIGSWVSYGLGTPNRNLPSFIAIAPFSSVCRRPGVGVRFSAGQPPRHARRAGPGADAQHPAARAPAQQRRELDALAELNRLHAGAARRDPALDGAHPLLRDRRSACRPPRRKRSIWRRKATKRSPSTACRAAARKGFAWQCLVARRLAERGVRFIELIDSGSSNNWDAHGDMISQHAPLATQCRSAHRGAADRSETPRLARRYAGGVDDGIRPHAVQQQRRRQGPRTSSLGVFVLAGRRRRQARASSTAPPTSTASAPSNKPVHVHDFHATILHLLGLDHTRLTYRHAGRDFRLTDVRGNVVHEIIAAG